MKVSERETYIFVYIYFDENKSSKNYKGISRTF